MAKIKGNANTSTSSTTPKATSKAARPKLTVQARIAQRIERDMKSYGKLAKVLGRFDHEAAARARDCIGQLVNGMADAATSALEIPADAKPTRTTGGGTNAKPGVTVGALVTIRDKRKGEYDGLLTPEELAGLRVTAMRGKKLVCEVNGTKLFIPRGHVVVATAAAA